MMFKSEQQRGHVANWRRTVYDDDPEPVPIQHGIECVPTTPALQHVLAEHDRHTHAPEVVLGKEEKEIFANHDNVSTERDPSVCGMPKKWCRILVAAVALAIAIAVAVAATVAVRAKQARSNSS